MKAIYEYLPVGERTEEQLNSLCIEYFSEESIGYDEFDTRVQRRKKYHETIDQFVMKRFSSLDNFETLLSFGCGTGRREVRIATELQKFRKIIGIEYSPSMATLAKSQGIDVLARFGDEGSPMEGSVDAAICLYSFVHLSSETARQRSLISIYDSLRVAVETRGWWDRFWTTRLGSPKR